MAEKVLFSNRENLLRYDNMSRDFGMSEAHFHNFLRGIFSCKRQMQVFRRKPYLRYQPK